MAAYATVEEYRLDTADETTSDERVSAVLDQQSAKLRAYARISEDKALANDQATLARLLVTDAARKCLVAPTFGGVDFTGATEGSFSANSFQQSFTLSNPSGTAYFDNNTLKAFIRSLGKAQSVGTICPAYRR